MSEGALQERFGKTTVTTMGRRNDIWARGTRGEGRGMSGGQ